MSGSNQPLSFIMPNNAADKIFFATPANASVSVPQNADPNSPVYTSVTIPHTEGVNFFLDTQLSPDNFNWYDAFYEPYYFNATFNLYFPRFQMKWSVTSTNVLLQITANDAAYTMFYRAVGYSKV